MKFHMTDGPQNDNKVNVSSNAPPEEALRKVHEALCDVFWKTWQLNQKPSELDPVKYSRLSVVSLTWLASVVAVDVHLTEEQFLDVCRANFREAYAKAPKFS
jgi:hypothetical protein